MNQIIENIKARRAVRKYSSKPIPREVLETIIAAGNAAPSGCNAQGWRFVVVEDQAFRQKLAGSALPVYKRWIEKVPDQMREMRADIDKQFSDPIYYSAPVVMFVIGSGVTPDMDCPMVCQNMMLAARSLGIGSCWVHFGQFALKDPEVKNALDLKKEEKVYGPVLFGYPEDGFPEAPPKKPAQIKWI